MSSKVKLFGRVRLTPRQQRLWLMLADDVPNGVTTVDELLQWVRARKAQWAADGYEGFLGDGPACLDALFEWSTGVEMPDPPVTAPRASKAPRSVGGLKCHAGGRIELERECIALILSDRGDSERMREVSALLGRRGAPRVVSR
jgi:hypothetical protein